MQAPTELPYSLLSQRHPTYNAKLIRELSDLYKGGYEIQAHAHEYLPKIVGEHETRWVDRLKQTAFIPYLGHVVDHFTSAVFAQPLNVRPDSDDSGTVDENFYADFANDADLASSAFHELCKSALQSALLQKRGLVAVDFPPPDPDVSSRLDEEQSGQGRAFCSDVCIESLIDWEIEEQVKKRVPIGGGSVEFDVGWFRFAVLHSTRLTRESPFSARDALVESWKIWRRDDESGLIVWEQYEAKRPLDSSGNPRPVDANTKVPLVKSGVTSFQRVPLVEMCLPDGLWLGNRIGPLNKEHYQRRSLINGSENRSLGAVPYVKLGPEIPGLHEPVPAEVQQDPNRGATIQEQMARMGYVVLGAEDDLGYLEPKGGYAELAENRLSRLVDEIYRVSYLMAASVSSTANAVGRSGASKAEDRHATTIVLQALGAIVREFARRVYEVISEGRGEDATWVATGLDHYDLYDRNELVDEATKVDAISIPSPTFIAEYKTDLASRLMPNLSPEEKDKIRGEIEKAVAESQKLAAEAARAAAAGSPPPDGEKDDEDDEQADEDGPPQPSAPVAGEKDSA